MPAGDKDVEMGMLYLIRHLRISLPRNISQHDDELTEGQIAKKIDSLLVLHYPQHYRKSKHIGYNVIKQ